MSKVAPTRIFATPHVEPLPHLLNRLLTLRNPLVISPVNLAMVSALMLPLFLAAGNLTAQSSTTPAAAVRPGKTTPARTGNTSAQPTPPSVPAAPPAPNWPANDPPVAAKVVWNSQGLLVVASNSSLSQILNEISLETGAKVEGFSKDERIFGTYGPASARVVLSQLLDGSNYDVLMVGDRGQGTPRQVVLSVHSAGLSQAGNSNSNSSGTEDAPDDQALQPQPDEPPQAQPPPAGYAPGVPVRTQQQIIEEMQERQRQQQRQQQNPQN